MHTRGQREGESGGGRFPNRPYEGLVTQHITGDHKGRPYRGRMAGWGKGDGSPHSRGRGRGERTFTPYPVFTGPGYARGRREGEGWAWGTIDSSLRCAMFRMTWGERSAMVGMTWGECCARNDMWGALGEQAVREPPLRGEGESGGGVGGSPPSPVFTRTGSHLPPSRG